MSALAWVPNALCGVRIGTALYVLLYYFFGSLGTHVFVVFVAAILTDAADGRLARKFKWQSETGAWLDPLSDKCLEWSVLFIVLGKFQLAWPVVIPIGGLAVYTIATVWGRATDPHMKTNVVAKLKTVTLFTSLTGFLAGFAFAPSGSPFEHAGLLALSIVALWCSLLLAGLSVWTYYQERRKRVRVLSFGAAPCE
jgi:CDP-diacylglycerol--glycerol-3-phosphate 3-phosphatidyltransferase